MTAERAQRGHFERPGDDALAVACPRPREGCGSAAGWACTSRSGRIMDQPHPARVRALVLARADHGITS